MTKDPKLPHISDSASGGKGESMAKEIRFKIVRLPERRRLVVDTLYSDMPVAQFWETKIGGRHEDPQLMAEECVARLEQIALRISETPARSSEARPGVGTAVESKAVDEKGLASRVEELEKVLAEAREGWMDSIDYEHEVGNAWGGNSVYPDKENCEENHSCIGKADQDGRVDCVAMRVKVIDAEKLERALAQPSGNTPGPAKGFCIGVRCPGCAQCR